MTCTRYRSPGSRSGAGNHPQWSGQGCVTRRGNRGILVCAEQFEVLQALTAGQHVVGEMEDVVGFEVGQVTLEQVQLTVDGVGQAQLPDQDVQGAEAAGMQAAVLVANLVMDVVVAEQAAVLFGPLPL